MTKKVSRVQELEAKVTLLEDQLKRALADYRNLERRAREESLVMAYSLRNELIKRLLPVLDGFDKVIKGVDAAQVRGGWLEGVKMLVKQLVTVLEQEGIRKIDTDSYFDPKLHEAADVVEGEEDKIIEVIETGYMIGGKVLRPAKVVVGKQKPEKMTEEQREETGN